MEEESSAQDTQDQMTSGSSQNVTSNLPPGATSVERLPQQLEQASALAKAAFAKGVELGQAGDETGAINTFDRALKIFKTIPGTNDEQEKCRQNIALSKGKLAESKFNHGGQLYKAGSAKDAIATWREANMLYKDVPNTEIFQAHCLRNIGVALLDSRQEESGIQHLQEALELYKKTNGTSSEQAGCHNSIAAGYGNIKKYDNAIRHFERALALYRTIPGTERQQEKCQQNINMASGFKN